ncbi:substance-P receptor-like isoform X1 [Ptychodera flava]|uniref:substance-P receptor-like isoform X1 n=1 Tax=Ptychodera flava TaxID=63121 RepID=UPI003969D584
MASPIPYIPSEDGYNFTFESTISPTHFYFNGSGNDTMYCPQNLPSPPPVSVFLWALVFGAMIVIATVGNIIVLWIVLAHRRMRTVTNYFIVNLALADAMNATFNVLFPFTYMIYNDWYYGNVYCKIQRLIGPATVAASIFTLMSIGIDRYIAIVHPMRPRMSKLKAKSIICLVWFVSVAINMPWLLYSREYVLTCPDDSPDPLITRRVCATIWPDGTDYGAWYFWYSCAFMVVTYVVPLLAQAICYTIVGIKLWGSQAPGEASNRHKEQLKAKRKVVKMLVIVVIIFAICWLPIHVYFLLGRFYDLYSYKHAREIYMTFYWLAMSNSMYNPFIYCWLNDSFRMGFKKAFRWLPCINYSKEHWSKVLGSGYARVTYIRRNNVSTIGNSVEVSGKHCGASRALNGHQTSESTPLDQAL